MDMIEIAIGLGKTLAMLGGVMTLLYIITWMERKQSAVMQDRIGANRAAVLGIRAFGLFHPLADSIKMITKEDFVPEFGNRFLHTLAPAIGVFFALASFAAIPFGNAIEIGGRTIELQVADINIGLLFVFAMMSLEVYSVILGAWSSNNNYAIIGGLRASAQMLSYEITMGATIIGLVIIYGTIDLNDMVRAQGRHFWGWLPAWGFILQPLGLILFLTAGIAETRRIPFDLPEAESEIIGYFIEYSGIKFGMFWMADFLETILVAALTATLFFGGWQVPYLAQDGFHFPWGSYLALAPLSVAILQVLSFSIKVFLLCWFLLLVRWTLPRFRYDQVVRLGWRMMLPLSLANVLVTGIIVLL